MCALIEPRLMIDPPPASRIISATAWAAKKWWRTLTAMRSSHSAWSMSATRSRWSLAALLTSTRIGPSRFSQRMIACCRARTFRTLHSANITSRPASNSSRSSASPLSASMSTNATRASCAASWATNSAPRPDAPPLTNAVRPRRLGYRAKTGASLESWPMGSVQPEFTGGSELLKLGPQLLWNREGEQFEGLRDPFRRRNADHGGGDQFRPRRELERGGGERDVVAPADCLHRLRRP